MRGRQWPRQVGVRRTFRLFATGIGCLVDSGGPKFRVSGFRAPGRPLLARVGPEVRFASEPTCGHRRLFGENCSGNRALGDIARHCFDALPSWLAILDRDASMSVRWPTRRKCSRMDWVPRRRFGWCARGLALVSEEDAMGLDYRQAEAADPAPLRMGSAARSHPSDVFIRSPRLQAAAGRR